GLVLMLILPKQVSRPTDDWSVGPSRRAREDTGLVGLGIGIVSLASQLVQLAIGARVVVRFLGLGTLGRGAGILGELVRLTNPLVEPFAIFFPSLRVAGHILELPGIIALVVCYLIGMAV